MKIKLGSFDPDPDLFFVNTGPGYWSLLVCAKTGNNFVVCESTAFILGHNNLENKTFQRTKFDIYQMLFFYLEGQNIEYTCNSNFLQLALSVINGSFAHNYTLDYTLRILSRFDLDLHLTWTFKVKLLT
jgi:hypothetical protein